MVPVEARLKNRVRDLREALGLSQQELGDRLEVSRQTVNSIEKGRYDPSLPLAFKIARAFRKKIEEVFEPED
jgi:putative transcriptional regulator